jgi:hypothetical protein
VRLSSWISGAVLLALSVGVGGCEKGKTRHLPPDPFAAGPAPAGPEAAPTQGLSAGLAKRPQTAGFFLDHIGQATDPFSKRPAVTAGAQPVLLDGFGFDPQSKAPAKGVDVVIDGVAYGTKYGIARPDVAAYFKVPALSAVGFRTTLPAGTLKPGAHTAVIRVVAADGAGFYDSPAVAFEVR